MAVELGVCERELGAEASKKIRVCLAVAILRHELPAVISKSAREFLGGVAPALSAFPRPVCGGLCALFGVCVLS